MIILGLSEFIRNIKRNILIIVQMVAVYIIAIFTVSAFEEQYRLMDGVSGVFDDTGMIVLKSSISSGDYLNIDEMEKMLVKQFVQLKLLIMFQLHLKSVALDHI